MMTITKLTCSCGAIYEIEAERTLLPDTDSLECEICGETLKSWRQSKVHLFATLVQRSAAAGSMSELGGDLNRSPQHIG